MDFFLDPNNTNNDVPSDMMEVNSNNNNNNNNNSFFNFNFENNIYDIVPSSNQDVLLNIGNDSSLQQQVQQVQQPLQQVQQQQVQQQQVQQQVQQPIYDNSNNNNNSYYQNNDTNNNNNNYYIPQQYSNNVIPQQQQQEQVVVYDNNCNNNNNNMYYQNQQTDYWTPQQQVQTQQQITQTQQPSQPQQNIIYTYSPSDTSTHSDSSPYQQDPSSPTTNHHHIQTSPIQTSPPSSGASDQCLSSSEESSELSKKVKLIKKRKLRFDPSIDIGPDLKDLLLEVSSEEFRKYKKNFYSGPDVKKSVANVINSQYRKIKNRESAQRSREKKSKYTEELEEQLEKSNKEKDDLVEENKRLASQVEYLKNQNAKLTTFISEQSAAAAAVNNNSNSFFNTSNGGLQSFLNSSFSIGSPQQNSKKLLGLFLFFFLFGSFVVQPNFLQYSNNHGHNHAYTQTNTLTTGNSEIYYAKNLNPNTYISNAGPRSNGFARTTLEKLNDNSISSNSYLNNNNNDAIKPHIMPTTSQSIVLDRNFIKDWATLPQSSKTTISFQRNNAQQLIDHSNLDKQIHSVSTSMGRSNDDSNNLVDDVCSSYSGSDEDELSLMPTESKRQKTTTTTTTTSTSTSNSNNNNNIEPNTTDQSPATTAPRPNSHFYNNSTLSLLVENQLVQEPNHQNSNITKFSNSLFKFSFLFDSDQFPNGSNDISKAFLESDDHQIDITSVIVAINKRPRTQL